MWCCRSTVTKLLLCLTTALAAIKTMETREMQIKGICDELPEDVLSEILGPAFNSRYMSIEAPESNDEDTSLDGGYKRTSGGAPSFFVDASYVSGLSEGDDDEQPAWTVNHVRVKKKAMSGDGSDLGGVDMKQIVKRADTDREKRAAVAIQRQWECQSKIHWIDLGVDYFPRYLRSVECIAKTCWYGYYKCKPRSFTVKILRRKTNRCTVSSPRNKIGVLGLPSDLWELWVWEERAVNFCCDCAL